MRYVFLLVGIMFLLTSCSSSDVDVNEKFIDYTKPRIDYPKEEVAIKSISPSSEVIDSPIINKDNYKIMSYFLRVDNYEAENIKISNGLKDIIYDYDLIFLQGVEAGSELVVEGMNKYSYRLSPVNNDERYIILYNSRVNFIKSSEYIQGFKFPPYITTFEVGNNSITFIQVRIDESDAEKEIKQLENVVNTLNSDKIIIIGTLFSDCIYYDANELKDYDWLLELDTLIGVSECSYDEIIYAGSNKDFIKNTGVNKLESVDANLASAISNHYPITMEIFY